MSFFQKNGYFCAPLMRKEGSVSVFGGKRAKGAVSASGGKGPKKVR